MLLPRLDLILKTGNRQSAGTAARRGQILPPNAASSKRPFVLDQGDATAGHFGNSRSPSASSPPPAKPALARRAGPAVAHTQLDPPVGQRRCGRLPDLKST